MTVINGLSNLYVGGVDLSGDAGVISKIDGGPGLLDVSTIDTVGMKRITGRFDGSIDYSVYFNPTGAHAALSVYPTVDAHVMVAIPATAGSIAAMLYARQVNYNAAIGKDLAASFTVQALASQGFPLEMGQIITAGKRTDTTATASGIGIDLGIPIGVAAITIDTSSVANPTVITTVDPHGLLTGDSVLIAGHTGSTPAVDGEYTVTYVSDTEFTIPVNVGTGGTGGTVQRTSHRGWAAQNQLFAGFAGTSVTVTVQDAHENLAGSFANLTGGAFAATNAIGGERIASAAGIIRRYCRVKTTGVFTAATFASGIWTKEG